MKTMQYSFNENISINRLGMQGKGFEVKEEIKIPSGSKIIDVYEQEGGITFLAEVTDHEDAIYTVYAVYPGTDIPKRCNYIGTVRLEDDPFPRHFYVSKGYLMIGGEDKGDN